MGAVTGPRVVVAVDGGGSKTDAVALDLEGRVLARARGTGSNPQTVGLAPSVEVVGGLVREVTAAAGGADRVVGVDLYLAGMDLPAEVSAYAQALQGCDWAVDPLIDNDLFALLRSGTSAPDAIAVVCGTGMNAVGLRGDGARVRFPALGTVSGDWGGGAGLGVEALWHAARAVDGRGPQTALVEGVCRVMGVATVVQLVEQVHLGHRPRSDLNRLSPEVFRAAAAGDEVAGALVDRQADEVLAFVGAIVRRLDLAAEPLPVVLGGSVLQAGHARLTERTTRGILALAPHARVLRPSGAPVTGAALLALERAGASAAALDRARSELESPSAS